MTRRQIGDGEQVLLWYSVRMRFFKSSWMVIWSALGEKKAHSCWRWAQVISEQLSSFLKATTAHQPPESMYISLKVYIITQDRLVCRAGPIMNLWADRGPQVSRTGWIIDVVMNAPPGLGGAPVSLSLLCGKTHGWVYLTTEATLLHAGRLNKLRLMERNRKFSLQQKCSQKGREV